MKNNKWLFTAAGIACLLFSSVLLHNHGGDFFKSKSDVVEETITVSKEADRPQPVGNASDSYGKIVVYVNGAVKKPGVFSVTEGTRLYEVLSLAGGFTEDADRSAVNLAARVKDGQQVNFPSCIETAQKGYKSSTRSSKKNSATGYKKSQTKISSSKINLNSATQEELENLPGVGAKTAKLIIDYRNENGDFTRLEDLLQIKGIGAKKYEKMKGSLTLGE